MTLKSMKQKTLSLIEEYAPNSAVLVDDEDLELKLNSIINQISMELMKYKKIPAIHEVEITDLNKVMITSSIPNFYKLNKIVGLDYELVENEITFEKLGNVKIYYYKLPKMVSIYTNSETDRELSETQDNEFVFDLSSDVLEAMPYGIASDLLKNDMISGYGKYFAERYREMKQTLDDRETLALLKVEGGIDV